MSHSPSDRRRAKATDEEIELNLLPFMNLMTLLIPFLLASVQFVTLAVIDSSLPAIGQPKPSDEKKKDDKPPLNLTVGITEEGFVVSGSAPVLGCASATGSDKDKCTTVPLTTNATYCAETQCSGGVPNCQPDPACHDFKALHELAVSVKKTDEDGDGVFDYDEEKNVILAPNNEIPYYVLVGVMDSTREFENEGEKTELFPNVVIAGGVK